MANPAGKTCPTCGEWFEYSSKTYRGYCKPCQRRHQNTISALRKQNEIAEDQCCGICGRSEDDIASVAGKFKGRNITPWRLDHCHETNTFRGYLCHTCNTGLGWFNDDPDLLQSAIEYLLAHKQKTAMQDSA